MFDSREYLLDEIALFANSNETLYRDTFKPIIDDGGLWGVYAAWEIAARAAIVSYIKANFSAELEQANAIAEKLFTKEDIEELADSFIIYYEEEMEESRIKSIEEHKAKMKELFGE